MCHSQLLAQRGSPMTSYREQNVNNSNSVVLNERRIYNGCSAAAAGRCKHSTMQQATTQEIADFCASTASDTNIDG
jgi:hypothetical protein